TDRRRFQGLPRRRTRHPDRRHLRQRAALPATPGDRRRPAARRPRHPRRRLRRCRMTLPAGTPTQQFIGGQRRDGSKGSFEVLNPSTGEALCSVPRAGADDVSAAIDAAAGALPGWSATAPRERAEVLRKTFELMIEHKEQLAYLMALEMGKSLTDARGEATYAAEFFRWFSEEAVRVGGELRMAPSGANRM